MSENRFAMISDWMVNGNINEFVEENPNVNRLELVSPSFRISFYFMFIGDWMIDSARRCCSGVDLHPSEGDDSWRPQGCMS